MNKFIITILFLVFGCWAVLGTNWYVCYVKNECSDHTLEEALAILDTEDENFNQDDASVTEDLEEVSETLEIDEVEPEKEILETSVKDLKPKKALDKFEVFDGKILFGAGEGSPENSLEVINHLKSVVNDFLSNKVGYKNLVVSGHTDNIGKAHVNTELGFKRAKTIKALLVRFGLSEKAVQVKSIGQFRPLGSNKTPEGRKLNRRVEIKFK